MYFLMVFLHVVPQNVNMKKDTNTSTKIKKTMITNIIVIKSVNCVKRFFGTNHVSYVAVLEIKLRDKHHHRTNYRNFNMSELISKNK